MVDWQRIKKKLYKLWKDSRTYQTRLGISGCAMLALTFTFVFFGPLEIVAFSGDSLVFTYQEVVWLLAGMMAAVLLVAVPLLALLRGRIFNYVISGLFTVAVGGYLQALLLNGGLGLLTGDSIQWTEHVGSMVGGLLLWSGVGFAVLLVMYLHRKFWGKMVCAVSCVLVIMQLVPTVGILLGAYGKAQPDQLSSYYLSDENFEQLGEENVLVFVLDRLDYDYIQRVLRADPAFFQGLDGFTSYTNAISGYARTKPALVHMLTGAEKDTFYVPAAQYYREAWEEKGNLLQMLQEAEYTVDLYSNIRNLFSDADFASQYLQNVTNGRAGMNYRVAAGKLLQLGAFRYAPTVLKPFFWADTNYYNEDIFYYNHHVAYQFDDAAYALRLQEAAASEEKTFKLYHFFGPHAPYTLNADGTASETETTVLDQTMGSFVNLMKIFQRMKDLGIYEDATIIITGDHGSAVSDLKPLQKATRIGLFYKPAGSAGTPLRESAAPVSVANIPATIAKAVGADHSVYGAALDEVAEDAQITRVYYKTVCDSKTFYETKMCVYHVTGDASVFENWELVETVDIPYSYN